MSDELKAALQPLVDLLSKRDPTDDSPTPEEEAEFSARHEAEQKAEVENTRKQLLRSVVGPLERWQDGVLARLKAVEDRKPPAPTTIIQQAPAADKPPDNWTFKVTSTQDGMAKTIVASADGEQRLKFTFSERSHDGFPRTLEVTPITQE